MKTIIAGGRNFQDYSLLLATCKVEPISSIISGHARGADQLGERYAFEQGITLELFPANWGVDGRSAGFKRNIKMAKYADALIAFWDGTSRGTSHMIKVARAYGLKVKVTRYD